MAQNTRSRSNQSLSDSGTMSQAELETLRDRVMQRENQIREQADALSAQREALERQEEAFRMEQRGNNSVNAEALAVLLAEFRQEMLNDVRTQIINAPIAAPSPIHTPVPRAPRVTNGDPPFRLNDIADSIPRYDGQKISVFQFSQACERALQLIPVHQEIYLVQLVMSKLQGHAYTTMSGTEYVSLAALLRKLKRIFGPNKSLNQYKGELGNAYMKPTETIFDYIGRIKELRTAILDCEIDSGRGDEWSKQSIEHDVLESFINGLPSDLLIRLKIEGFECLDDAMERAIQLSKTLETEALRKKASYTQVSARPPRYDAPMPRQPENRDYPPPRVLQRPSTAFIRPLIPGQPGPNAPSQIICYYCREPGHVMNRCEKRLRTFRPPPPNAPQVNQRTDRNRNTETGNGSGIPTEQGAPRDTVKTSRQILINTSDESPSLTMDLAPPS